MMAVSMMHMDTVQETARAKLGRIDDSISLAGKLGAISGKVSAAQNEVVQSELQSTDDQLALIDDFQSRYVDNAAVNEADNQRFQDIDDWAAQRGIDLENPTKVIQEEIQVEVQVEVEETDPDTGEVTTHTETQTATQTQSREVYDLDAIAKNQQKLQAYKASVTSGQADNPVIRDLLSQNPLLQEARTELEALGYTPNFETLGGLQQTNHDIHVWTGQLIATIQDHLLAAKVVYKQLTTFSDNWSDTNKDAASLSAQETEKARAYGLMEQATLKLFSTKKDQISQITTQLGDAIQETEQLLTDLKSTV
ncbi:hypothetical protein GC197_08875 [bacterium]|nr:hypothetical protein [bacterium]